MVHRRVFEGQTLIFGNQGALWGNAMTWWDHDTGSIWSQPLGEAVAGPRRGATLETYPVSFTTWDAWRDAHPNTIALDAPGRQTRFDLEEMYIVVDFGAETAAYPVLDLQERGVVNDVVAGVEIAVVSDPADSQRWSVLSRRLDDNVVELAIEDGALIDIGTGTEWDPIRGIARGGPLSGEVLNLLPGFTSFPGDYRTFWPDGRLWRP